jgi:hypothetical protein
MTWLVRLGGGAGRAATAVSWRLRIDRTREAHREAEHGARTFVKRLVQVGETTGAPGADCA